MSAEVVSLCDFRARRAAERAWDLSWVSLELLDLDAMAVEVRSRLALAESETERNRHLRFLVRLSEQRARYLAEQRRLQGGGRA
jgi:hypothetical protein